MQEHPLFECKTGDILISRTTKLHDLIGEYTIGLGGLHCAIILRDPLFEKYSECGSSPSGIYCTLAIDKIFPIEEIFGQIWIKPNGCELVLIKRKSDTIINPKLAMDSILEFRTYEPCNSTMKTRMAILAFFKIGWIDDDMIKTKINYGLCSQFVGKVLYDLGLVDLESDVNSLLPHDFYNLEFKQTEEYERIVIFNKDNFNIGSMIKLSLLNKKQKIVNALIEKLLKNYNFPRVKFFYPLTLIDSSQYKK